MKTLKNSEKLLKEQPVFDIRDDIDFINAYTLLGVNSDKVIVSQLPSIATWSLTRKCLVNENNVQALEVVIYENDGGILTYKNNRIISMMVHEGLTSDIIEKINNSNGIIISKATDGKENRFRFGYIPTE